MMSGQGLTLFSAVFSAAVRPAEFFCFQDGKGCDIMPSNRRGCSRAEKGEINMDRPFAGLTVTEKAARSLRAGHPWVYEGEVLTDGDPCPDGEIGRAHV